MVCMVNNHSSSIWTQWPKNKVLKVFFINSVKGVHRWLLHLSVDLLFRHPRLLRPGNNLIIHSRSCPHHLSLCPGEPLRPATLTLTTSHPPLIRWLNLATSLQGQPVWLKQSRDNFVHFYTMVSNCLTTIGWLCSKFEQSHAMVVWVR